MEFILLFPMFTAELFLILFLKEFSKVLILLNIFKFLLFFPIE